MLCSGCGQKMRVWSRMITKDYIKYAYRCPACGLVKIDRRKRKNKPGGEVIYLSKREEPNTRHKK
jgi:uncharacterized Zn finger protein